MKASAVSTITKSLPIEFSSLVNYYLLATLGYINLFFEKKEEKIQEALNVSLQGRHSHKLPGNHVFHPLNTQNHPGKASFPPAVSVRFDQHPLDQILKRSYFCTWLGYKVIVLM
jgi:hypothetical protein